MMLNGRMKIVIIMFDRVRLIMKCFEYECRYENFIFVMYMSVLLKREVIIIININIKLVNVNLELR